ncbi:MAG: hypothetical protein ACRD1C_08710 [Terriglobales bacterium]
MNRPGNELEAHLATAGWACIFLSLFGALWMVLALNAESWVWLAACVFVPASLLVMRGIGLMVSGHEARRGASPRGEERAIRQVAARRIGWIILVDFGAMTVTANILYSAHLAAWTISAMAALVAVQFLVWPTLLGDGLYYVTAASEIAAVASLVVLFQRRITLADSLFGLAMGLTLWLTVVMLLLRGRHVVALLMQAVETASPR